MSEVILAFKDIILDHLPQIWRLFVIPFMSLGIVYIFGRLIPLFKTDDTKNLLALFSMMFIAWFTGTAFTVNESLRNIIWDAASYTALSTIIYVTVCWKLYDRMDSLLDKKIGEDKPHEDYKKPRKKAKRKKK